MKKTLEIGVEYTAFHSVMQQGTIKFPNPPRRFTWFGDRWVD